MISQSFLGRSGCPLDVEAQSLMFIHLLIRTLLLPRRVFLAFVVFFFEIPQCHTISCDLCNCACFPFRRDA